MSQRGWPWEFVDRPCEEIIREFQGRRKKNSRLFDGNEVVVVESSKREVGAC